MAAYDIHKQLRGLRVDTAKRKGRRDPFATTFDDDSDDDAAARRKSRPAKAKPADKAPLPKPARSNTLPSAIPANDDSDDNFLNYQRPTARPTSPDKSAAPPPALARVVNVASPFSTLDAFRDSDDDFLDYPRRSDRRLSPAPAQLHPSRGTDGAGRRGSIERGRLPQPKDPRNAILLAAGPLAYLDESDDEDSYRPTKRADRVPSPAPFGRQHSNSFGSGDRSVTPGSDRIAAAKEQPPAAIHPPRHTVASAFAGTKYLEDSESEGDDDEEAVASRQGSAASADSAASEDWDGLSPLDSPHRQRFLEVKRVDKPKQHGSGISWRAFSDGRNQQRSAEIEALQASFRQRGRRISFSSHAITDDGRVVPIALQGPASSAARGRKANRGKSPPRRVEDVRPSEGELGSAGRAGVERPPGGLDNIAALLATTAPVTANNETQQAQQTRPPHEISTASTSTANSNDLSSRPAIPSQTSASTTSATRNDDAPVSPTDMSAMTDSLDSIQSRLTVSPPTIPEGKIVEHSMDVLSLAGDDRSPISRVTSTRSMRTSLSRRSLPPSRKNSRHSTSFQNVSLSPAQTFLSSWARDHGNTEPAAEPRPDDKGQEFGLNNEYIIGETINHGAFGVVKEAHTLDEHGHRILTAVKIVRKSISGKEEVDNEKAQQELEHEVSIWRHMDHRHVLKLIAVYDTEYATFCVMDRNVGGTLFDVVNQARKASAEQDGRKGLEPRLAKSYAYQLACALRYLHEDIRVCHRDVKLENCLVDMSGPQASTQGGKLLLCDFGLADFLHSDTSGDDLSTDGLTTRNYSNLSDRSLPTTSSIIGTLEYASPKGLSVHRKLYETAGDVWAFGIVVYALCTGELPFKHAMPSKTVELILHADWDHHALRHAAAGGDAVIELVRGCLERDIDLRWTIGEALRSTWFDECRVDAGEGQAWSFDRRERG